MRWFNEILTALKGFLNMEHDATEQEVHQKLSTMKSLEAVKKQMEQDLRHAIEAETTDAMGAQIMHEAERADTAEARVQELEAKLEAANTALDALQSHVNQLRTDAEALRTRIAELEKLPATSHTDGQPGTTASDKPYLNNPIYQRAMKIRGSRNSTQS